MKRQRGAALVEFAIIAAVFFMLLFGIIEVGRAFYIHNGLQEAVRRGARVAAVCPVTADGIRFVKHVTIYKTPDSTNTPLLGLSENNIRVKYYDSDMALLATDTDASTFPASVSDEEYDDIAFVEVSLAPQNSADAYRHTWIIPFFYRTFAVAPMITVLPSESLGRISRANPVTKRCCPGNNYGASQACTTT
jgi:Flp pilus assembly protein TadG